MAFAWIQFLALAAVIAVAGNWLSRFGDAISEKTGLSGSWIGLVLVATVTSLPELATGISAVRTVGSADLAVGDVLGSCVFNLLLLSVLDLLYRRGDAFAEASPGHALSAAFGSILLAIVGLDLAAGAGVPGLPLSPTTLLVPPLYLVALRSSFTFERRLQLERPEVTSERYPHLTLRRAAGGYAVAAAAVVAAGVRLPAAAAALADAMAWSDTLVGTLFLAATTSLPELVVVVAAVRMGAIDMAFANLLGSNLFDLVVLAVDDLAFSDGPLLVVAGEGHATTVLTAILMSGIVAAGVVYRPRGRPAGVVSWASLGLIVAYAVNAWFLAAAGTQAPP